MSPARFNQQDIRNWLAPTMFSLSLVFLVLIAALIVVWVDIPRVELLAAEAAANDEAAEVLLSASSTEQNAVSIGNYLAFGLLLLWPLFWVELGYHVGVHGSMKSFWQKRKLEILPCLCPPLRLAAPSYAENGKIWLPKLGWQQPGKPLVKRLERIFGSPMLVIALLILPILSIEFGLKDLVEQNFGLRLTLHICTGFIWCAFAIEFIVMVSATDRKLAYVKKNWIDLAIVLLPLISFLRSLRVVRAIKVAKFAKVQQLARVGRVYRMRGLMAKALRALMLFEFLHRLLRITPDKKLDKLMAKRDELAEEMSDLDEEIRLLQERIKQTKTHPSNDSDSDPVDPADIKVA